MTRDELLKAFDMRIQGRSWSDISEAMHYSVQNVTTSLYDALKNPKVKVVRSKAYPLLALHITEKYDGVTTRFSRKCGVSVTTLREALRGERALSKESADKIRKVAGNIV